MYKSNDRTKYKVADTFVLRAPLLPFRTLQKLSSAEDIDGLLRYYFSRKEVSEALILASPELYKSTMRWMRDGMEDKKIRYSLMKYLIRMSSRCTPFGFFAGVCPGSFGDKSNIMLSSIKDHQLYLRPDMQFLCKLAEQIISDKNVRPKLKYYPNTSLYKLGDEYRYVEYESDEEGLRHYKLQSVQHSKELETIIDHASYGALFGELQEAIADEEVSRNEVGEFIHLLIDNQLLVSDLEPSVTGEGYFVSLKKSLKEIEFTNPYIRLLSHLNDRLLKLQSLKSSSGIGIIEEIIRDVKESGISFKENALIQADLKLSAENCSLPESIKYDLENIIPALKKLSRPLGNSLLERFKKRFLRRYEEGEVPLSLVMDAESGLGYLPDDHHSDNSFLIEGIRMPEKERTDLDIKWTLVDSMLYRKLQIALMEGQHEITINDNDLKELPDTAGNFSPGFSVMAKVFGRWKPDPEKYHLLIESAGGSSALKIAGRFGYLDDRILDAMEKIADIEQGLHGDFVLAEIAHLPQQRTGNILLRPVLRKYEIPYLARPSVSDEFCIPIRDLMVSIKNNKVLLRSVRLNKYILPRMSNAHNYAIASLSVYRFLCDLQSQDTNSSIGFSWGSLEGETIFLPRVSYENFILARASWNLNARDLKSIVDANNTLDLKNSIAILRKKYRIPQEIVLVDADNELWLDLESPHCTELFQQLIKRRKSVLLQEFISPDGELVKAVDGSRTNEFVFFLYQVK